VAEANASIQEQIKKFWSGLSRAKKIALIAITSSVLIGVIAIATLGSRVRYAPLYTGLSTEDSAAIVGKLKELKVLHRVTPTAIEVPEDDVHELRLELASAGLPRGGGVGFEIFDSARFGATEFEQQVNLRRALEGELSRSITTIEGVMSARVHLVLPERRLFAARSEGASASVVVKLQPGIDFGKREVAGIVHLVSSAVPGLSKDRVSVVNTDGITLHRPGDGGGQGTGLEESQNQAARDLAPNMENHVRTLLERVTGPGGADVRINVDLEDASRERTEEHYEPTKSALRSEHKSEETTTEEGSTVAGVPGAQTNLPDVEESVASRDGDLGGNIFRRTRTRNWEVDRITEKIVTPRGDIARVSAAVLIDGNYETKDGVQVYQPRDPKELERLEEVVKNAIGFNVERGDSIRVEGAKFSRLDAGEPPKAGLQLDKHLPYLLALLGLLTLLAMLIIFLRAVKTGQKPQPQLAAAAVQVEGGTAKAVAAVGSGGSVGAVGAAMSAGAGGEHAMLEGGGAAGALGSGGPDAAELAPPTPAELEDRRVRAIEYASKDPVGAAIILTRWLSSAEPAAEQSGEGSRA
jgi:flagellar M-ring protein FliF